MADYRPYSNSRAENRLDGVALRGVVDEFIDVR
jgi:hypothetical protein